jgi:hypothetical protein
LVVVVALVAAAGLLAPATLLDAPIATRTQGRVRLVGADGFWWRGHGELTVADAGVRIPIAWHAQFADLARGIVIHLLPVDAASPVGTITIHDESVDLRELRVRVPAAVFGGFDARLNAVALGGTTMFDVPAFTSHATGRTGELRASWDHARIVAGETVVDLGTVSLVTAPEGERLSGTIGNVGGDLAIAGTLADRPGGVDVVLALRPKATTPEAVRSVLPLLGVSDGAGGVPLVWQSDR